MTITPLTGLIDLNFFAQTLLPAQKGDACTTAAFKRLKPLPSDTLTTNKITKAVAGYLEAQSKPLQMRGTSALESAAINLLSVLCKEQLPAKLYYEQTNPDRQWEDLTPDQKFIRTTSFANKVLAETYYQFKTLSWNEMSSIDSLSQQVSNHGPLVVNGFFGKTYHPSMPMTIPNVLQGRTVYLWGSNTPLTKKVFSHTVVIVGVKPDGKGGGPVYFVDPLDEMNPEKVNEQKIYCIPFDKFISPERLLSLMGEAFTQTQMHLRIAAGYAYYNPHYNSPR